MSRSSTNITCHLHLSVVYFTFDWRSRYFSLLSRICQSPFSIKFSPNLPHCSLIGIPAIPLNLLIKSRIFYPQFRILSFYRCQSYRSCCCSYVTVYVYYTDVWSRISNAGFIMPKRERRTERQRGRERPRAGKTATRGLADYSLPNGCNWILNSPSPRAYAPIHGYVVQPLRRSRGFHTWENQLNVSAQEVFCPCRYPSTTVRTLYHVFRYLHGKNVHGSS